MKVKDFIDFSKNMGGRYLLFRAGHELRRKSGLLKKRFPVNVPDRQFITLEKWKQSDSNFFFESRQQLSFAKKPTVELQEKFLSIKNGRHTFFNSTPFDLGNDYDWLTNPDNGYKYSSDKHWTEIHDLSKQSGDIKYVWEKSRFNYLYTIIRYDYHFDKDHSSFVFDEIIDWIDKNPINCGPNYRCSQEISLRILNWTFALNFYKHSPALTESFFNKMINSIYWQLKHVYSNINFSRIAVRNNHAITETLMLYLSGILFPFIPESEGWSKKSKVWFEKEIEYQVYRDGTYLQFSMNYHRVVVQLMTWAIQLSKLNNRKLADVVFDRATSSLNFLRTALNETTGHLPNYGANDGALFFPLNDCEFRDFRPQLQALAATLGSKVFDDEYEDRSWYNISPQLKPAEKIVDGPHEFKIGGYYILREKNIITFIRCGGHKDRPSQADNLHLDITIDNENILRDGGSYKYNTSAEDLKYFFGTASHNTVMLGDNDQMKKGGRFMWFYWTQVQNASWKETPKYFEFAGSIKAFGHLGSEIHHSRRVRKIKGRLHWEVIDDVSHSTGLEMNQIWNTGSPGKYKITLQAIDEKENGLKPSIRHGWYSSSYGKKVESNQTIFSTSGSFIHTCLNLSSQLLNEHTVNTSVLSGEK